MNGVRYEKSDAPPRLIAALAAGIGAFLIAAPLVLAIIYVFPRRDGVGSLPLPPEPRLQIAPGADLARLHAAEDRELTTYGWLEQGKGQVRLPIDRAMELIAQRGIPGWDAATPDSPLPPRVPGER